MQNTLTLKNKTSLITGASSGIGYASAIELAKLGSNLILVARRIDKVEKLALELKQQYDINTFLIKLDVRNNNSVISAIKSLPRDFQDIDILVNNAGLSRGLDSVEKCNIADWENMIDTNIKGLLYVTHAVLPNMIKNNFGHIINIGSIAGQECYPGGNVYSATKAAVKSFNKSLRIDLLGKNIKVTEIAPGAVETEFSMVRFNDELRAKSVYQGYTPLDASDIADAVIYAVTRKPHVNIGEILITPVAQASATHIARSLT
jgi:3-hydroxy acid dehydrogenase / malonic semialdehyde reductase